MIDLKIIPDVTGAFPDMTELGGISSIGRLDNGTERGKAVILVEIIKPDGTKVYGQTTMNLFRLAGSILCEVDDAESLNPPTSH